MSKPTVTINDIAKIAGVSKATISRVMSNPGIVKDSTRKKVLEIINEHNFVPNSAAQSLAGAKSKIIGIVVQELYNSFFMEIIEGVDSVVSGSDYSLLIFSSNWQEEKETRDVLSLINKRVDGVILSPINESNGSLLKLRKSNLPFVIINYMPQDKTLNYVAFDNYKGGKLVAEYINRLEKEQVVLIQGYSNQPLVDRVRGFMDHVEEPGKIIQYQNIRTFEDGESMANILISRHSVDSKKTVLFVTNDNVSIGLMNKLHEEGIKIPERVSVVGFDNIKLSALSKIPLTTISQSIKDMGRLAAYDLLDLINGVKLQDTGHVIQPKLIEREST